MIAVAGINMLELYYDEKSEHIRLIRQNEEHIIRIQLYDVNGIIQALNFEITENSAIASTASLDKGTYFLRILTGTGTQLLTFVL